MSTRKRLQRGHAQNQPQPNAAGANKQTERIEARKTDDSPSENDNGDDSQRAAKNNMSYISRFCALPAIDKFTGTIAIFTALLAAGTIFNVWAFIQSERSEVAVADIRFTDVGISADKFPRTVFEIKNSSKATAYITEFRLAGGDGVAIPDNVIPPSPTQYLYTPVYHDVPAHFEADMPRKFSQEEIDVINKGQHTIWIVGTITYGDRFGWLGGGEIGFCFYYDPSRGRGVDSFYRCHDPRYEY